MIALDLAAEIGRDRRHRAPSAGPPSRSAPAAADGAVGAEGGIHATPGAQGPLGPYEDAVKSPKVYFRDTGLLHYFLGILSPRALDTHPARGASWEAFVIDPLVSAFSRTVPGSQAFFWRTARGDEVDLLVEGGGKRIPFEIKRHSAPRAEDARGLLRCMTDLGLRRGYLVYPGREPYSLGHGVTTLPAAPLLAHPERVARL
jgi:predicted AAA+ superfamily ATPase